MELPWCGNLNAEMQCNFSSESSIDLDQLQSHICSPGPLLFIYKANVVFFLTMGFDLFCQLTDNNASVI